MRWELNFYPCELNSNKTQQQTSTTSSYFIKLKSLIALRTGRFINNDTMLSYKIDTRYVPASFTILCQQTIKINYSILFTQDSLFSSHRLLCSIIIIDVENRVLTGYDGNKTKRTVEKEQLFFFFKYDKHMKSLKALVKLNCWLLFFSYHLLFLSSMTMTTLILSQWYDKIFNDNIKYLTRTRQSLEVSLNEDSSLKFVMTLSVNWKESKISCWQC